jgi:hypothetical protein
MSDFLVHPAAMKIKNYLRHNIICPICATAARRKAYKFALFYSFRRASGSTNKNPTFALLDVPQGIRKYQ